MDLTSPVMDLRSYASVAKITCTEIHRASGKMAQLPFYNCFIRSRYFSSVAQKKTHSNIFKWDEMLKFLSSKNHNRILTKAKSQGTPGVFARNPGPGISDILRSWCQMRGAKEAPISNLAFLHLGDPNRLREMPQLLLRHDGRRSGVGHLLQLGCISCFPVHPERGGR